MTGNDGILTGNVYCIKGYDYPKKLFVGIVDRVDQRNWASFDFVLS